MRNIVNTTGIREVLNQGDFFRKVNSLLPCERGSPFFSSVQKPTKRRSHSLTATGANKFKLMGFDKILPVEKLGMLDNIRSAIGLRLLTLLHVKRTSRVQLVLCRHTPEC